jgi:chromosome segregation ATPase
LIRQNEGLVDNVKLLKSEMKLAQIQLANKEQKLDSISRRGNELAKRSKATRADLAAKTAEFDQVPEENEQLRTQLEDAEREVRQCRAILDGLINSLQSQVVGETDEIVLGGLRKIWGWRGPSPAT